MTQKKKIIFLVGPTAVGKSKIALELAKIINGEIISCDSMQVYKELNIISDKIPKSIRKRIPHHLVDIVSIEDNYNVSDFSKQALKAIEKIHAKGKMPLIVGGSGLYMKVMLDGVFEEGKSDIKIRRRLYSLAKKYGNNYLFKRLERIDPEAAGKIHPHDLRRIVRALEVYETTNKPISQMQKQACGIAKDYDIKLFGLNINRDKLYDNINRRVDEMFEKGLVGEIKRALKKKLSLTAAKIIGIREIRDFLNSRYTEERARELIKRNTRHYAKRQLTWFRKEKRIRWIEISGKKPVSVARKIKSCLN
ncbi:MAG: tRNA (adenosine(37)-N6)-dimethylallyltransferase MiaA [Candidatus Omnitrophica bacterium]|nr:tRNA (adenosine(37)-N6)-dimethylallyltransferase MiaA [Candidatus Omnitrophota bacterium]HOX54334.1 tRNA (adenosine(37)-N6)-dimethylallyltransferase MiaA [Candidatus Omnitrophota bacterium]